VFSLSVEHGTISQLLVYPKIPVYNMPHVKCNVSKTETNHLAMTKLDHRLQGGT
jgi:hypothetical protein